MADMTLEEARKRLQEQFPNDPHWEYKPEPTTPSESKSEITFPEEAPYAAAAAGAASGLFGASKEPIQAEIRARNKAIEGKATLADLDREIAMQRKLVDAQHGEGFFDAALKRVMTQRALGQMPNVPNEPFDPMLGRMDETKTYARERQTGFGMGTKNVWDLAKEGDKTAQELIKQFQAGKITADVLNQYSAPVKRILVSPAVQEAEIAARTGRAEAEALGLYPGVRAYQQRLDLESALPTYRRSTSSALAPGIRTTEVLAGSRPRATIAGALGGAGAVLSAEEAAQRWQENDPIGAAIAGVGAAGDVAAMIPLTPNPYALAAKGTGILAGALSPLALMAYDKYRPQVEEFAEKHFGYNPSVMPK